MSAPEQFVIGAPVECSDGECGALVRVVINPVARKLTHVVVLPSGKAGEGGGKLVPVELVSSAGERVVLSCDHAGFEHLDDAEEEELIPGVSDDDWGYPPDQLAAFPYYGLTAGGTGMNPGIGASGTILPGMTPGPPEPEVVRYDRIPLGEVEVRRGAEVRALDGRIGKVEGLIVDPSDGAVTHVLLQEGHLWGKKDVAVPIAAVSEVLDDEVHLNLSKDEVRDLPAVRIDRPGHA